MSISISKNMRVIYSLVVGGLLLIGLLLALDGTPHIARADPGALFVTPTGTGTACTTAQPCTLQEAVAQAADGDTVFVAQGTYTGSGAAVITITKSITLYGGWSGTGTGALVLPDVYTATLDGENARRVVYITGTVSPILDGFTLRNGLASGGSGGAVYAYNASPVITNCRILDSVADRGGGAAFWYGAPVLGHSLVMGNVANGSQADDGGGGVSLADSKATVEGNIIRDNDASNAAGGGVAMLHSAGTFEANTILGNQAMWAGGLEIAGSDPFTMTNNIVALNTSQNGAPVRVYGISNHPACSGGCPSQGTLLHNTFVTNTSSNTSWMISVGPTATLDFANTIIGLPGGIRVEEGGSVTLDRTLWETGSETVSGYGTFLVRRSLYGDPAFLDPGGGDYHIGLASSAIDRGIDAGLDGDVDGQTRPQGDGYDIGADETGLVVTKEAETPTAQSGAPLTYTIRVANTSDVTLNAIITDHLPVSVTVSQTSGGTLILPSGMVVTWTAVITAPGGMWIETLVVDVDPNYVGSLINLIEVTTQEGAKGNDGVTVTAGAYQRYLPLMMRVFP